MWIVFLLTVLMTQQIPFFKCQYDSRLCECRAMVVVTLVLWLNSRACDKKMEMNTYILTSLDLRLWQCLHCCHSFTERTERRANETEALLQFSWNFQKFKLCNFSVWIFVTGILIFLHNKIRIVTCTVMAQTIRHNCMQITVCTV